jgi:citrate lyase subunit beta/citryl-CoA lyase
VRLRSLLFVPGDRPERFTKAAASAADALIFDLEDSVALARKPAAREAVAAALDEATAVLRFVRVNPLGSGLVEADLDALTAARPDAIVLPKAEGAASIRTLDSLLAHRGLLDVPLMPIASETPAAIFELGSYRDVRGRLVGLTWGAEDLPAAIGAMTSREDDGRFTPPYELARSLTLFAAAAAYTAAIDTVYPAFRDLEGLGRYAARAARDGFVGMMAIHPTQVGVINAAFSPSDAAILQAQRVVAIFQANPDAGALQLDGAMIDAPHLSLARRILQQAGVSD